MTEEELQTLRLMMREEVGSAVYASEQRTGEQLQSLRLVMREEVGAAVHASEQRLGSRMDRLDNRMDHIDGRMGRLDGRMDQIEAMQRDIRDNMIQVRVEMADVRLKQEEMISVLQECVRVASEAQADQRALEIKVDESLQGFKRTLQYHTETTQKLLHEMVERDRLTNERLTYHENIPFGQTHPRPPQPGAPA